MARCFQPQNSSVRALQMVTEVTVVILARLRSCLYRLGCEWRGRGATTRDYEPPLRITDSTVQSMGSLSGAVLRLAYSWLSWESSREALAYKSAPWLEVSSINFTVHHLA